MCVCVCVFSIAPVDLAVYLGLVPRVWSQTTSSSSSITWECIGKCRIPGPTLDLLNPKLGVGPHSLFHTHMLSHWVVSTFLQPHGRQHPRLPCPPLSPAVCSASCPLSRGCYLTISSSATSFSFCLRSFPTLRSFPMSRLFASGGQKN